MGAGRMLGVVLGCGLLDHLEGFALEWQGIVDGVIL